MGRSTRTSALVFPGTGQVKTPIFYTTARAWGLIGWVRPLIGIVMDGVAATVEHEPSWPLTPRNGQPRYFRLQADLPPTAAQFAPGAGDGIKP